MCKVSRVTSGLWPMYRDVSLALCILCTIYRGRVTACDVHKPMPGDNSQTIHPRPPAVPNNTVTFIHVLASLDSEPCSPGGAYVHAPTGRHSCTWWVPDNQWVGSSWLLPTPSCNRALQITCPEIDLCSGPDSRWGIILLISVLVIV